MVFKFVVSDPKTRKSYQLEISRDKAAGIIGKKIGDEIDGSFLGLSGYRLQITGGSDKDGFPMHPEVRGMGRRKILLDKPPGFHPKKRGQRKRKTVRGNIISDAIVQINMKVIKAGTKPLDQLLPKTPKGGEKSKEDKS
jgi:small subunit ribosomal protein S6e